MVYLYILRITLSVVVSCCFFSILRTYCILYHELQVRIKVSLFLWAMIMHNFLLYNLWFLNSRVGECSVKIWINTFTDRYIYK